jgi:hypothetical protein
MFGHRQPHASDEHGARGGVRPWSAMGQDVLADCDMASCPSSNDTTMHPYACGRGLDRLADLLIPPGSNAGSLESLVVAAGRRRGGEGERQAAAWVWWRCRPSERRRDGEGGAVESVITMVR